MITDLQIVQAINESTLGVVQDINDSEWRRRKCRRLIEEAIADGRAAIEKFAGMTDAQRDVVRNRAEAHLNAASPGWQAFGWFDIILKLIENMPAIIAIIEDIFGSIGGLAASDPPAEEG